MKIRNGFVSNSSSSSFVIGYKGSIEDAVKKVFELPEGHALIDVSKSIIRSIVHEVRRSEKITSLEELIAYYNEDYSDTPPTETLRLMEKGMTLILGSFSDESGDVGETLLCESSFSIDTDDFYFKKDGGY